MAKDNPRIRYVSTLQEAEDEINRDFSGIFPVQIRGVITSLGEPVDLSFDYEIDEEDLELPGQPFGNVKVGKNRETIIVKNIEDTLRDGTEFDINECELMTRVCGYNGNHTGKSGEYCDPVRIDIKAEIAGISEEERARLRSALLVYDKNVISPFQGYSVKLPQDPSERAKAILKAFVIGE